MRVLIVTQYFWPESFIINDLAVALGRRGHDITVLTGVPNYPSGRIAEGYGWRGPWEEQLDGVPIFRVPLISRGSSSGARLSLNYASFAASATVLGRRRIRGDFDVIFVYEVSPVTVALPAIALRRRLATPLVLWVQDVWPDILSAIGAVRSRAALESMARLTRWIYARSDRILASSRAFIPRIEAQGVPSEKIAYVPNWAEAHYEPVILAPDAPERRELPDGFRVLFGGNIGEAQAFGTILGAAERLRHDPTIQWAIVGEGRHRQWVEGEVAARGLASTVHLLGRRPASVMPRYFAAADALLVSLSRAPLYSWTVPSKLQSYMACAKPMVAALEGEGARIVEESGGGLVAGAEDPGRLADAVLALNRMTPQERQAMGARSRHYFEQHFARDRVIDDLERMLTEAVANDVPHPQ